MVDAPIHTREEILEQIKLTAQDGKPLGEKNFFNATGIRRWDWGYYWPTWGEAVKEAGFTPNLPWMRYPEGVLEERMIGLIRRLSKYPTISEMRIEGINDPSFPFSAIKKKKAGFIRDIILYCEKTPSNEDILKICRPPAERLDKRQKSSSTTVGTVGEVYLFKRGKYHKIGRSNDPVRRGREIKLESPDPLALVHTIKTDDPQGIEQYWHKRFESKRYQQTEFFSLDSQDIAAFKRWKKIF